MKDIRSEHQTGSWFINHPWLYLLVCVLLALISVPVLLYMAQSPVVLYQGF